MGAPLPTRTAADVSLTSRPCQQRNLEYSSTLLTFALVSLSTKQGHQYPAFQFLRDFMSTQWKRFENEKPCANRRCHSECLCKKPWGCITVQTQPNIGVHSSSTPDERVSFFSSSNIHMALPLTCEGNWTHRDHKGFCGITAAGSALGTVSSSMVGLA